MTAPPALRLDGLEKRYGALHVTRGVSLEVRAGEIHALIGPNGAGKSTLVAQVSGQLAPDAGRIYLGGADVTRWSAHRRARAGLGRTFQVSSVFGSLSALDNVQVALNAKAGRYSPWRAFRKGAPRQAAEQELAQRRFPCDGRPAQSLGYGTVREIELLMGLVPQPTVLLLDEPLAGLSHAEARNAIAALAALRGRVAMLLVEHDMQAVFALAERITVLVGGAVIASGTPAEIRQDPAVRAAYLGDS